ncbi:hypothetical protein LCGC14_1214220 [marine sediment metagenome]|uniref:Uncharacterized protein n=1 Tax=marine sediment metagenome TaxID=412755 RepID=A0A0F9NVF8_9ZZZZ
MTRPSDIRKRLLKQRGVELKRLSRKPIPLEESPTPYRKTNLMRLVEYRFKAKLDDLIFKGTIYEVERAVGVDATTVSKWRKLITAARDAEFFGQFK